MSVYIIGMIVCGYAMLSNSVKDWITRYPGDKQVPFMVQAQMLLGVILCMVLWPIALAIWMRDIKEPKK